MVIALTYIVILSRLHLILKSQTQPHHKKLLSSQFKDSSFVIYFLFSKNSVISWVIFSAA